MQFCEVEHRCTKVTSVLAADPNSPLAVQTIADAVNIPEGIVMDEQESTRMDEREFRRILDLFPIVRSRHYNADEQLSKGSTSKSLGNESIREWQDSWDEGSENEPESEGMNKNDAFWEKLKLATEKKVGKAEAEKFCREFRQLHHKLVFEKVSVEVARNFVSRK